MVPNAVLVPKAEVEAGVVIPKPVGLPNTF